MKIRNLVIKGLIGLPALMLVFSAETALAQWRGYDNWGMGPGMMGGYGTMGWFGPIFMIAFWILIIVGLVFLIKWLVQSTRKEKESFNYGGGRAMDILKERYARGDIDREEFEQRKRDLQAS